MRLIVCICTSISVLQVSACAIVPDFESADDFNYATIVNQVECELYRGSETARLKFGTGRNSQGDADPKSTTEEILKPEAVKSTFEPSNWTGVINLVPDLSHDIGASFPFSGKNTLLQNQYDNVTGGGGPSGSPLSVELYGESNVNNNYSLALVNLYLLKSDVDANSKQIGNNVDPDIPKYVPSKSNPDEGVLIYGSHKTGGSVEGPVPVRVENTSVKGHVFFDYLSLANVGRRVINAKLKNQCIFGTENFSQASNVVYQYPIELGGALGIESFLLESLAASNNGTVSPKSLGFTKSYKLNIVAGVTPGWYAPFSSFNPGVGGYRKLYDQIALSMTKNADPVVQLVCVVRSDKASDCKNTQVPSVGDKRKTAAEKNPPSDRAVDFLINNRNMQQLFTLPNK